VRISLPQNRILQPGIEIWPPRCEAGDYLLDHGTSQHLRVCFLSTYSIFLLVRTVAADNVIHVLISIRESRGKLFFKYFLSFLATVLCEGSIMLAKKRHLCLGSILNVLCQVRTKRTQRRKMTFVQIRRVRAATSPAAKCGVQSVVTGAPTFLLLFSYGLGNAN